jgi:moderate conductance mechanosensitive channel
MVFFAADPPSFNDVLTDAFQKATTTRALVIILLTFLVAYVVSTFGARLIIKIAQAVSVQSDIASTEERNILLRRVETYLSVAIAVFRAIVIGYAVYVSLNLILPQQGALVTTIGAGTFFVVFANATLAPLLRDFTSGALMIIERWYSVGDFIRVEPFVEVGGVVERVTLRSTKLRNINGEAIWLHNQYVQGVKVTPRGVRTMAVDIFVRKPEVAEELVEDVSKTLPTGPTMLASPLKLAEKEQLADNLWRITLLGKTAPGREWLIERFLADALKDADANRQGEKIIVYGPLVRYADKIAESRFRRAVRAEQALQKKRKKS